MLIPYLIIAIRFVIVGLAIICALAGFVSIRSGKLSLAGSSQFKGQSARVAGVVLLVVAVAMVLFAIYVFPQLLR